jgi:hypothetical protein
VDSVKEIALTFCAAAVLLSGISLLGTSALEKSKRYIITLIMLCSVIGSVANAEFDFSLPDTDVFTASGEETAENISAYQAEYIVADLLKKEKIKYEKVTAKANKNQDGSIVINEITISGAEEREKILSVLRKTGIDCRVVFD